MNRRLAHESRTLPLRLPRVEPSEAALRRAFNRLISDGRTFEQAMNDPAMSACLRNVALAEERRGTTHRKGKL